MELIPSLLNRRKTLITGIREAKESKDLSPLRKGAEVPWGRVEGSGGAVRTGGREWRLGGRPTPYPRRQWSERHVKWCGMWGCTAVMLEALPLRATPTTRLMPVIVAITTSSRVLTQERKHKNPIIINCLLTISDLWELAFLFKYTSEIIPPQSHIFHSLPTLRY